VRLRGGSGPVSGNGPPADNDRNHYKTAGFEHWAIGKSGLFRISSFRFRVLATIRQSGWALSLKAPDLGDLGEAAPPKTETTGIPWKASLCGCGGDAGAGHFGAIEPPVNVLAGANPNGRAGFRLAIPCLVKIGNVAPPVFAKCRPGRNCHRRCTDAHPFRGAGSAWAAWSQRPNWYCGDRPRPPGSTPVELAVTCC
jgi:hypothetical protein